MCESDQMNRQLTNPPHFISRIQSAYILYTISIHIVHNQHTYSIQSEYNAHCIQSAYILICIWAFNSGHNETVYDFHLLKVACPNTFHENLWKLKHSKLIALSFLHIPPLPCYSHVFLSIWGLNFSFYPNKRTNILKMKTCLQTQADTVENMTGQFGYCET